MKKLVSLFLVLALALSMVGIVNAETEKTKIIVMCWGSTDGAAEDFNARVARTIPEFAEKYEVEFVLGGQTDADVSEKLRYALSSNEYVCDIVYLNYTQVPEFARAGALYDVTEEITPYLDGMTDGAKALAQYDGKYIAVPNQVKSKMWFYRADIFEECGIDVSAIKNVDDLIAAGKKIQEKYPDSYIANLGHAPSAYNYYLTLSGNGASFFDENGNYNISKDEGTIKMLEDYKKMIDAGVVMDVSDWTTDWENALANGQLVSQFSANWLGENQFLPTYSGEENRGNWKCTVWPEIGGTQYGSDAGGAVWAVTSFAKYPKEAAELICNYALGKDSAYDYWKTNGGTLPQNNELLSSGIFQEGQEKNYFGTSYVEAQIEGFNYVKAFNYSPNASMESNIVCEYFTKAVYGDMSIEDALSAAENDLNMMIGNAYD